MKLLIQQKNGRKSKTSLLILKKEKNSSSQGLPTFSNTKPTAIINVSVEQQQPVPTSCYYRAPYDPPALPEQGKVQLLSISCKFPSGSPVYLPRVEVNLVVVPCYSKPERGDGVLTAVYL